MFYGCKNLTNIDLSSFDTKNVIDIKNIFYGCKNLKNFNLFPFKITDFSFFNDDVINYAFEFVFEFRGVIKTNNNENYLIKKFKALGYLDKKGDMIKFENKIILVKENEQYIINFVENDNNADCVIIEYDVNDKNSFIDIELLLNNSNDINKTKTIYLIGINFNSNDKIIVPEAQILSEINNLKYISISSKNDNDIKSLLSDLIINLKKNETFFEEGYNILFLAGTSCGVGKTSLILRITENKFLKTSYSTTSFNRFIKTINSKTGKKFYFQLFDIDSQQRCQKINLSFIKKCDCVILVYDVTNKISFDKVKEYYKEIITEFKEIKLFYLIGNKIDLIENIEIEKEVSEEEAIEFANEKNLRFFEISCKENIGIKEFNIDLINEIIKIEKSLL